MMKTLNVVLLMQIMMALMILVLRRRALARLPTVMTMLQGPLTDLESEDKLSRCVFRNLYLRKFLNVTFLTIFEGSTKY